MSLIFLLVGFLAAPAQAERFRSLDGTVVWVSTSPSAPVIVEASTVATAYVQASTVTAAVVAAALIQTARITAAELVETARVNASTVAAALVATARVTATELIQTALVTASTVSADSAVIGGQMQAGTVVSMSRVTAYGQGFYGQAADVTGDIHGHSKIYSDTGFVGDGSNITGIVGTSLQANVTDYVAGGLTITTSTARPTGIIIGTMTGFTNLNQKPMFAVGISTKEPWSNRNIGYFAWPGDIGVEVGDTSSENSAIVGVVSSVPVIGSINGGLDIITGGFPIIHVNMDTVQVEMNGAPFNFSREALFQNSVSIGTDTIGTNTLFVDGDAQITGTTRFTKGGANPSIITSSNVVISSGTLRLMDTGILSGYALCVRASDRKVTTCASAVGAGGACTCP